MSSRTLSKPWALIDGNNGILTKLDKFLNLLRQHVSSSSNNSENTSLCLSVSYVHEKPDLIVGCRVRQTYGFLVVYASVRMHHFSRNTLYFIVLFRRSIKIFVCPFRLFSRSNTSRDTLI